ncbi:MAG TPA: NAD(+)/NADH kinase [Myxococcota bacterium]|nr:NAD(+)/NADH kinase [Myxococcota bacterium]
MGEPQGGAGSIRCVGLCVKPDAPAAGEVARRVDKWLAERGIEVLLDAEAARWLHREGFARSFVAARADLLVVLGGDGTLLSVARETGTRGVPILGVNLGTLGFLAEVAPDELSDALARIVGGDFRTVRRLRLDVRAERDGETLLEALALNDAVITRGETSRMIDIETFTDGLPMATYRGDGLIAATPTGSTAYSLSAGGPILLPEIDAFVITPICPHTLTQRPVVLPRSSRVEMRVLPREGIGELHVDGRASCPLERGDRVHVACSEHPARFVISPLRSRFDVLRAKLHWGAA